MLQEAFDKRGDQHRKCLQESLQLQKRLRLLTHRVLAAQESERKVISRELHDEIAQTLLGINVRLLSLKLEARTNSKGLKREISNTQKLVSSSVRTVHRVVRGLGAK
jgi:signal transduction histidine kinase